MKVKIIKLINSFLASAFLLSSCGITEAATLSYMPEPGQILAQSPNYDLPYAVGIKFDPADPLKFIFIINKGQNILSEGLLRREGQKIVRYFLAALTIPEEDLWVNLSPYEASRIVPDKLSVTDLGRDMLGEDYVLKQMAASLTYPESEAGKKYWDTIIGVRHHGVVLDNVFNKVWIMPGKIHIYEEDGKAYIDKAYLKVMMEEDYLAATAENRKAKTENREILSIDAFKTNILPLLEKEVNTGKNFAQLRQLYYSIILASWFKEKLKHSFLSDEYFNKRKVKGVDTADPRSREQIYQDYLQAFKKGAYNCVKRELVGVNDYSPTQKVIKRQYFSGGEVLDVRGHFVETPGIPSGGWGGCARLVVRASPVNDNFFSIAKNILPLVSDGGKLVVDRRKFQVLTDGLRDLLKARRVDDPVTPALAIARALLAGDDKEVSIAAKEAGLSMAELRRFYYDFNQPDGVVSSSGESDNIAYGTMTKKGEIDLRPAMQRMYELMREALVKSGERLPDDKKYLNEREVIKGAMLLGKISPQFADELNRILDVMHSPEQNDRFKHVSILFTPSGDDAELYHAYAEEQTYAAGHPSQRDGRRIHINPLFLLNNFDKRERLAAVEEIGGHDLEQMNGMLHDDPRIKISDAMQVKLDDANTRDMRARRDSLGLRRPTPSLGTSSANAQPVSLIEALRVSDTIADIELISDFLNRIDRSRPGDDIMPDADTVIALKRFSCAALRNDIATKEWRQMFIATAEQPPASMPRGSETLKAIKAIFNEQDVFDEGVARKLIYFYELIGLPQVNNAQANRRMVLIKLNSQLISQIRSEAEGKMKFKQGDKVVFKRDIAQRIFDEKTIFDTARWLASRSKTPESMIPGLTAIVNSFGMETPDRRPLNIFHAVDQLYSVVALGKDFDRSSNKLSDESGGLAVVANEGVHSYREGVSAQTVFQALSGSSVLSGPLPQQLQNDLKELVFRVDPVGQVVDAIEKFIVGNTDTFFSESVTGQVYEAVREYLAVPHIRVQAAISVLCTVLGISRGQARKAIINACPWLSQSDIDDLANTRETDIIACGTITKAGHAQLSEDMMYVYGQMRQELVRLGVRKRHDTTPLTENEVIRAAVSLDMTGGLSEKNLHQIIRALRSDHTLGLSGGEALLFTPPRYGTACYRVQEKDKHGHMIETHAVAHFSFEDDERIHFSPIFLARFRTQRQRIGMAKYMTKHEVGHLMGKTHASRSMVIPNSLAKAIKAADIYDHSFDIDIAKLMKLLKRLDRGADVRSITIQQKIILWRLCQAVLQPEGFDESLSFGFRNAARRLSDYNPDAGAAFTALLEKHEVFAKRETEYFMNLCYLMGIVQSQDSRSRRIVALAKGDSGVMATIKENLSRRQLEPGRQAQEILDQETITKTIRWLLSREDLSEKVHGQLQYLQKSLYKPRRVAGNPIFDIVEDLYQVITHGQQLSSPEFARFLEGDDDVFEEKGLEVSQDSPYHYYEGACPQTIFKAISFTPVSGHPMPDGLRNALKELLWRIDAMGAEAFNMFGDEASEIIQDLAYDLQEL